MKIKVHNSMGKVGWEYGLRFIFNDKIFIDSSGDFLRLYYQIDDCSCFLRFYHKKKEFEESYGFGENEKIYVSNWWKYPHYQWKEMSK